MGIAEGSFHKGPGHLLIGKFFQFFRCEAPHGRRRITQCKEQAFPALSCGHGCQRGLSFAACFALANAGVQINLEGLTNPVAFSTAAGLLFGKTVGVVLLSFFAVRFGLARLPYGVSWAALAAGGVLAGIGFTMALFIAGLALEGALLSAAKVGILAASGIAAIVGTTLLYFLLPDREEATGEAKTA